MSYAQPQSSNRRLMALVAVGVFHVLLVYALVNGLARKIVEVVRAPLETKIIEEVTRPPQEQPPAPPPPPKLTTPPPPFIPPPEVQVQVPVQPPPTITAVVSTPPPAPIPAPAAPASAGVVGTPARANCEKPPYPAAARRAGETGAVRLNVLVSTEGKILESKMQRSSGYRRLDDLATQGLRDCKPKPAIVDGRPQQSWVMVEFNFSMND
jgi:protein TonB